MPLTARCILGRMKKSRNRSSALPPPSVAKTSPAAKAHSLTVPNAGRVAVAIMAAGKGTRLKSQLPNDLRRRKVTAYPAVAEGESKEILGAGTQA